MDLVKRDCAVCHKENHVEVFDQPTETIAGIGDIGYHHKINICRDCGFVFASPVLSEKMILSVYEKMSNYEQPQNQGLRPQSEKNQIHRYADLISKRFPKGFKGKALDVGCATAYGLSQFKARGWDVIGLDPSPRCIELSKQCYDVHVIKGFFEPALLEKEKPFDLIILCHVLEHLLNPDKIIKQLSGLLSENGIVYLEVPNLMKPYALRCYFCFEHLNFFTPATLTNLINSNGLTVDSLSTFDNGQEIAPYYPVISITLKQASKQSGIINDYHEVMPVIERFKKGSVKLIKELQVSIDEMLKRTPKGRLAIWGAGIHTSELLSETTLRQAAIACIFDNNPKKHGSRLLGHLVEKFPDDVKELKKRVDAILISSEASENDIYNQIKYLEDHGVKIYRLYERGRLKV